MPRCGVCFRHCVIEEGGKGFCGARTCTDGKIRAESDPEGWTRFIVELG